MSGGAGRGEHRFVDVVGVPAGTRGLRDEGFLLGLMREAAREAGASVVASVGKRLGGEDGTPEGVTCAVLLNESHLTAHTYAEAGAVAIDAFTCGKASARKAVEFLLARAFPGGRVEQDRSFERFVGFPQETGESRGQVGCFSGAGGGVLGRTFMSFDEGFLGAGGEKATRNVASSPDDLLFDPAHVRNVMEEDTTVLLERPKKESRE